MRTRIRCLWHDEQTASLIRRKDDWRCYGACNKAFTHEEVEAKLGRKLEYEFTDEVEDKEVIQERYEYVETLSYQRIRGLLLRADKRGYFITWPDKSYYKYRLFDPGDGPKYLSPKGHKPSLLWCRKGTGMTLILAEGELNALSLAEAFPEYDVASPGSASMFSADNLGRYLPILKFYRKLIVILDDDSAGLKGLIEAKAFLLYKIPFVDFILMKTDANEVLSAEGGKEALRERVSGADRR